MKHYLVLYPHDILRTVSRPIVHFNKDLQDLIQDMKNIMNQKNGLGIAAPQVNSSFRCFLARVDNTVFTFINPEITEFSDETNTHEEGCLSIPGVFADVERPYLITVKAVDSKGKEFTMEAEGMLARIIQHELDHLNGVLFFDHLERGMRRRLLKAYEKLQLPTHAE